MKRIIIVLGLLFAASLAWGQIQIPPGAVINNNATAGGTCSTTAAAQFNQTGGGGGVAQHLYNCPAGTLVDITAGSGGSGAVSGQANGVIPLATAGTVIGAQSHLSDNGTSVYVQGSTPEPVAPFTQTVPTATAMSGYLNAGIIPQNFQALRQTATKVANMQISSPQQLRIVNLGDSTGSMGPQAMFCNLAYGTMSPGTTINQFAGAIGGIKSTSGFGYNCPGAGLASTLSGDATMTATHDYVHFLGGFGYTVGAVSSGCVTWSSGGGYFNSNLQRVYYELAAGSGTLTIDTNNSGAGWVNQFSGSAAGTATGEVWSQTVSPVAGYQIRACGTGGAIYVWNAELTNTTVNGVVIGGFTQAGSSLPEWTTTASAITGPWWTALNPDLVLIHWEQNGTARLPDCELAGGSTGYNTWYNWTTTLAAGWLAANANADTVIFGQWPVGTEYDTNQCMYSAAQSQANWAFVNQQTFIDQYYQVGPGDTQATALGWFSGSEPHYTATGELSISQFLSTRLGIGSWMSLNEQRDVNNQHVTTQALYLGTNMTVTPTGGGSTDTVFTTNGGVGGATLKNGSTSYAHLSNNSDSYLPPFQVTNSSNQLGPFVIRYDANTAQIATANGSTLKRLLLGQSLFGNFSANASGSYQIDMLNGQEQILTLTGAATLTNPAHLSGLEFLDLTLCQNGTGGYSVATGSQLIPIRNYPPPQAPNQCITYPLYYNTGMPTTANFTLRSLPVCTLASATNTVIPCPLGIPVTISGCGTAGSIHGNGVAGDFTVGTGAVNCTFTVTLNGASGLTAQTGWIANADDTTAGIHCVNGTTVSTTTVVFTCTGTVLTSDLIKFSAAAY